MTTEKIDWNEASARGLIVRINTEILHPLGLAMCRDAVNGTSPHLLVSDDGVFTYSSRAECARDVFDNGNSICLVDIPKDTAEVICRNLSAVTGWKVDWHYVGGRVHIKALPNSPEKLQGKPVGYISQKALDKLVTHPMSSACIDGYARYKNSMALYSHPELQPLPISGGTTSDKYRAELYDEVWQKARDMGFANVTEALARLKQVSN